jgi:hypothetical protein
MPLIDFDDPAVWNALYDPPFVRENRERVMGEGMRDGVNLRIALGLTPGVTVGIIGGGFGWIAEEWIAYGINAIVTDISALIQANKTTEAVVPIEDLNVTDPPARERMRTLATTYDLIVTEDVLPCYSDAECLELAAAARTLAPVAHWVSPYRATGEGGTPQYAGLNWKSLEDWKALMTPDRIVERGSSVVF